MRLQNLIAISMLAIAVPNVSYGYEETRSKANYLGIEYLDWTFEGDASTGGDAATEGAAITLGRDINNFFGIEGQVGAGSGATVSGIEQYDVLFLSLLGRFNLHFEFITGFLTLGYSAMAFDYVSPAASDDVEGAPTLGAGMAFFLSPNFAVTAGGTAYLTDDLNDVNVAWRAGLTWYFDWPRLHPRY